MTNNISDSSESKPSSSTTTTTITKEDDNNTVTTTPTPPTTTTTTTKIRTFTIPISTSSSVAIQISEPALRAEGLSLQTWTSSYVLASLLHRLSSDRSDAGVGEDLGEALASASASASAAAVSSGNGGGGGGAFFPVVLELGAGTGLVGLTAAMVWKMAGAAAAAGAGVVLTDLGPIVPGLKANVELNAKEIATRTGTVVQCAELDWNNPTVLNFGNSSSSPSSPPPPTKKPLLILAADTIYSEDHPALLSTVILTWLSRTDERARAILTYPMRVAYLDQIRELWRLLEEGGLEAVGEGRVEEEDGGRGWDDEGLCEWCVWRWKKEEREKVEGS